MAPTLEERRRALRRAYLAKQHRQWSHEWKLFLVGIDCEREESNLFRDKIKNDVFRTLKTDKEFHSINRTEQMNRILNRVAHKFGYVQGMNVLLAPFVFYFDEESAISLFQGFLLNCSSFIAKDLKGVFAACELLDESLHFMDEELYSTLKDVHGLTAKIYAFQRNFS